MIPTFGETLRNLRLSRNLSQGKLAKRLEISISTVGLYENSSRMPSYEILIRMARLFSVSTDFLLGVDIPSANPFQMEGLTPEQAKVVFAVIEQFQKANEKAIPE